MEAMEGEKRARNTHERITADLTEAKSNVCTNFNDLSHSTDYFELLGENPESCERAKD
jgi:hypothetical protein